jgi:hypothetical protein
VCRGRRATHNRAVWGRGCVQAHNSTQTRGRHAHTTTHAQPRAMGRWGSTAHVAHPIAWRRHTATSRRGPARPGRKGRRSAFHAEQQGDYCHKHTPHAVATQTSVQTRRKTCRNGQAARQDIVHAGMTEPQSQWRLQDEEEEPELLVGSETHTHCRKTRASARMREGTTAARGKQSPRTHTLTPSARPVLSTHCSYAHTYPVRANNRPVSLAPVPMKQCSTAARRHAHACSPLCEHPAASIPPPPPGTQGTHAHSHLAHTQSQSPGPQPAGPTCRLARLHHAHPAP